MLTHNTYCVKVYYIEVNTMKYTIFSIRPVSDELLVKLDEDAKKQDRSRNYIINDILMKHYKLARD